MKTIRLFALHYPAAAGCWRTFFGRDLATASACDIRGCLSWPTRAELSADCDRAGLVLRPDNTIDAIAIDPLYRDSTKGT